MSTKTKRLLELALTEAEKRIMEYTPSDLNALIKNLSMLEKAEENIESEEEPIQKSLKGFITQNIAVR